MCSHCVPGLESESPLNKEFAQAVENPQEFDNAFVAQREAAGLANFGYDPVKAAELREKELARIAAEWESETPNKREKPEPYETAYFG